MEMWKKLWVRIFFWTQCIANGSWYTWSALTIIQIHTERQEERDANEINVTFAKLLLCRW